MHTASELIFSGYNLRAEPGIWAKLLAWTYDRARWTPLRRLKLLVKRNCTYEVTTSYYFKQGRFLCHYRRTWERGHEVTRLVRIEELSQVRGPLAPKQRDEFRAANLLHFGLGRCRLNRDPVAEQSLQPVESAAAGRVGALT
jgi:hypothetical protein